MPTCDRVTNHHFCQICIKWEEKRCIGFMECAVSPTELSPGETETWMFRVESRPPHFVFLPARHHAASSWWAANCQSVMLCSPEGSREEEEDQIVIEKVRWLFYVSEAALKEGEKKEVNTDSPSMCCFVLKWCLFLSTKFTKMSYFSTYYTYTFVLYLYCLLSAPC